MKTKPYYTVKEAIAAECTLEPLICRHCKGIGEVSLNTAGYYCSLCGKYQTIPTIRPKSDITCQKMNCIERDNKGDIYLTCCNCNSRTICSECV